jgi:hypothetical protein
MRIESSTVGMESARRYHSTVKQEISSVTASVSEVSGGITNREKMGNFKELLNYGMEDEATGEMEQSMLGMKDRFKGVSALPQIGNQDNREAFRHIKRQCMMYLIMLLFGDDNKKLEDLFKESGVANTGSTTSTTSVTEKYYVAEKETTRFSTEGKVVTEDGKEINFQLNMEMSRSFQAYYEENYVVNNTSLCDPLVINLDSDIASLNDQKFLFDLDTDGILDNISTLNSSSGYLAVDKNQDGTINNGSELFGTASGNGFADLLQYDLDGNGWIDENDPIWKKLLIRDINNHFIFKKANILYFPLKLYLKEDNKLKF